MRIKDISIYLPEQIIHMRKMQHADFTDSPWLLHSYAVGKLPSQHVP